MNSERFAATPWQLAFFAPQEHSLPEDFFTRELAWQATEVPGSVQTSGFGLPLSELYQGDRVESVRWMEEMYWVYRTEFVVPAVNADEEAVYLFQGIDYQCRIYLDAQLVCKHEGMFSPVQIPLPVDMKRHELTVLILPFEDDKSQPHTLKARYSFGNGWDFTPKLQSRGIWDEAGIVLRQRLRITTASVQTRLDNQQRADVTVRVELSERVEQGEITVTLDGVTRTFPVVRTDSLALPFNIPSPTLWWPNGMGEAALLELRLQLRTPGHDTEPYSCRVGLRSVQRVAAEGQGVEDIPLQLLINNRKVFIKGMNWVPLDACPGSITPERYRPFLEQFHEAGVNMIRVWGGGLKEKAAFYHLADELGLLILQEFPLACQRLTRSPEFYALLTQEVSAIIRALSPHPSVVIWSGGNELYSYWDQLDSGSARMTALIPWVRTAMGINEDNRAWRAGDGADEPALALMGELCARLDGSRPYQITSAMEGEGEAHGIWTWDPTIGDHRFRDAATLYQFWLQAQQHLYSECSVSSIANAETMQAVLGEKPESCPGTTDPIWRLHYAFHAAWDDLPDLWLDLPSTEKLFGTLPDMDSLIVANQWMQGEGGRFLIEEQRRKMPHACGIIWWGANEPWPGLAGNALLDYYARPKLSWQFIANAFKPTILSLRYPHCVLPQLKPELWISHEGQQPFAGRYEVELINLTNGETDRYAGEIACDSYSSHFIRMLIPLRLAAGVRAQVTCRLFAGDNLLHRNDYLFASPDDAVPFDAAMLALLRQLYVKE